MGKDLQDDHESLFFIGLNEWIYENAGASWERPAILSELTEHEQAMEAINEYVSKRLSSRGSKAYSGRYLKKGLFDMEGKWGWKDPRNGPALPVWKSIWPDMRIVHVTRHGVDVASSLKTRNSSHWEGDVSRFREMASNILLAIQQVSHHERTEVIHNGGRTGLLVRATRDGEGHTERYRGQALNQV